MRLVQPYRPPGMAVRTARRLGVAPCARSARTNVKKAGKDVGEAGDQQAANLLSREELLKMPKVCVLYMVACLMRCLMRAEPRASGRFAALHTPTPVVRCSPPTVARMLTVSPCRWSSSRWRSVTSYPKAAARLRWWRGC